MPFFKAGLLYIYIEIKRTLQEAGVYGKKN